MTICWRFHNFSTTSNSNDTDHSYKEGVINKFRLKGAKNAKNKYLIAAKERSWIISFDEVHCSRVYETVIISNFVGFEEWNSNYS